ncbi:MAG: ComEC/Rec2 family competence protein, partial [Gemmatimonadaceae bacterium]
MPLLLAATLAWIAGSLAGLAGAPAALVSIAGAIATVALIALLRSSTPAALLLIALAALQLGADLRRADEHCRVLAARSTQWDATLLAPASPGSYVRATMHRAGEVPCTLPIAVAVRSGTAGTGARVMISRAEPSGNDRGLLLREARLEVLAPPGPLDRWRDHVARSLDRTFGTDAPMVRALLIADTRGLSPELRERYADAGLVHMLSISGLHVAIVGGALLLLLQSARLPANMAAIAAVATTALYVLAIGAPPPALRSATLFAATTLTRLIQRPVSPWATFSLGAMLPLYEPRTVLDLGWQLSVGGYAAIVVAGRLGRRLPETWRGWRRALAKELIAGALTTAVTAPLVAWHFGRLSVIAPVSNLVAGPVISLLQPTLFLAMLTPEGAAARFVVDAATPMLRAMDAVANIAASSPGAAIVVAPSALAALLAGAASVAVLVAAWSRHWAPPLTFACACVALMAWLPDGVRLPSHAAPRMELHMIDVGQGDAIALRSPRGRWVLVDAGRAWTTGDAG